MAQPSVRRAPGAGGGSRQLRPGWIRAGVLGAAIVLLGGLACGDGPTEPTAPPPPPPPPRATTVAVTPASASLSSIGETVALSAEVRDQNGRAMPGAEVAWASADAAVVTVDAAGLVRAEGSGTAAVTASSGSASGTASVSVTQSATSVTVTPAEATIGPGDTLRLAAEAFDANGHPVAGAKFWWSSSDPSVAMVDTTGLVRGIAEVSARITAASGDALGTAEITVVNPDRAALVALYEATDGPNWNNNENWLSDRPLGEWYGVWTDAAGRVQRLDLGGRWDNESQQYIRHGLAGQIPVEMASLANLERLHLGANNLSGPIPPELGGLANLKQLYLYRNKFFGPIPPELGGLANLERLDLSDNEFSGTIPPELGRLARLAVLFLNRNDLSGTMPAELGRLANLERLYLNANDLSGSIPSELGGLAKLTVLYLHGNDLSGTMPAELGGLAKLERLYLYANDLSGPIPPELGRLAKLERLRLRSNTLSGPIPPELGSLANLTELSLQENDLSGTVPRELRELAKLTGLNLGVNNLSGPVPPELGDLANLTRLHLGGNDLSGPIPAELGNLARLETLSLLNNHLAGPLPPEFGRLAGLTELDLTNNAEISGALPASLTDLHNLEALYARGTGLCAPDDDAGFRAWLDGVAEVQMATCAPTSAYLVQAVQSREIPVPLVAGEEALLRVFVTADRGTEARIPPVRARFYLNGTEALMVDIPAGSRPIPAEVDESALSKSANAVIPPEVVRPGLEMVVEIDPDGTLDSGLGVAERIPATGRLAVDVREMPRFDLTVIPFLWASEPDSSVIGVAKEMAADPERHELLAVTRTLLPVADIAVTAHASVTSSSNSVFDVLRETAAIRAIEGGSSHYMGMMARFSDVGGVAFRPGRSSASVPGGGVIAHEFGHNMNLLHAPCGGAGDPDPRYPYPDGSIGAWGYDFPGEYDVRPGEPVSPGRNDLMGYCGTGWISDYHFTRALAFRLVDEGPPAAASEWSILVWGGVDAEGAPFLEPAFVVDAPPVLPDSAGEYAVTGQTAEGGELFSLAFAMPEIADADGGSSFVFVVPAEPGWEGALVSLTLTGPDGEAMLDAATNRPMAILRDSRSGQLRAFLRNLPPAIAASGDLAAALSSEPELEALFSRGIPDPTAWRR